MLPYDALNCGNHELYQDATVSSLLAPLTSSQDGHSFIDHWNGTYITSNVGLAATGGPLGADNRYAVIQGTHGTRLLVFGFLYEMSDHCASVTVDTISHAVSQSWWHEAMARIYEVDAVVVLAHMHYIDPREPVRAVLVPSAQHVADRSRWALCSSCGPWRPPALQPHPRCSWRTVPSGSRIPS